MLTKFLCLSIRNVSQRLDVVSVTRLIRIAYGDYRLKTIPPGMALSVPYKPIAHQKAKGLHVTKSKEKKGKKNDEQIASPVKWVTSIQ